MSEEIIAALSTLDDVERTKIFNNLKIQRETQELRERLPAFLNDYGATLSVSSPAITTKFKGNNGAYMASIHSKSCTVSLRVDASNKLVIECTSWGFLHRYLSGSSSGLKTSIRIYYGDLVGKAESSYYDDPGNDVSYDKSDSHVKEIIRQVSQDMGLQETITDKQCILVLYALVGRDGKAILRNGDGDTPSLYKIIRDDLNNGDPGEYY